MANWWLLVISLVWIAIMKGKQLQVKIVDNCENVSSRTTMGAAVCQDEFEQADQVQEIGTLVSICVSWCVEFAIIELARRCH